MLARRRKGRNGNGDDERTFAKVPSPFLCSEVLYKSQSSSISGALGREGKTGEEVETVESRTESEIICSLGGRGGNVVPPLLLHSRNTFVFPFPFFPGAARGDEEGGSEPDRG